MLWALIYNNGIFLKMHSIRLHTTKLTTAKQDYSLENINISKE